MKVLVIGAAGKLGIEVVQRASAAGHTVTAFVHNASEYQSPAGVRVFEGDATNATTISSAVGGQDAVLDALGGKTPYKATDLEATAATNITSAMEASGVRRLVVTSMLGEGDSQTNAPFLYQHLMLPTFLHGAAPDKANMESTVRNSSLDWIILRPAILTDGDATGNIRVFDPGTSDKAHKISRADVAQFMVDQLSSDTYLGKAVTLATS